MFAGKQIAIIGAGHMAEALVAGMLKAHVVSPDQLCATDVDGERLQTFERTFHVRVSSDNGQAASSADVMILAVKPQVIGDVLGEMALSAKKPCLVVSIVAGTPIARILAFFPPSTAIVRAMPNMPAMVAAGVTALAGSLDVSDEEFQQAERIFLSVGKVVRVHESLLDAVTGLSGGGPAYVYMVIEALTDGGVKMGLSRSTAHLLAAQTVLGAAKVVLESHEHPGVLKDKVMSPGGTTIAGVHELEKGKLRALLMSAVESATLRSKELGLQVAEKK